MTGSDPRSGPRWNDAGVVGGFATAAPNEVLLAFARMELTRSPGGRVLDLGCGAARNAAPMAALGATVVGTDVAWPMLEAARRRVAAEGASGRVLLAFAPMDRLPLRDASVDLVVAHGIWNLARSAAEFRRALREAARVARPGAGLFVFTFSRATLPPDAPPVPGEPFVFTQFSGEPQCFLTEAQLDEELSRAGFERDSPGPLTEYNRPVPGRTLTRSGPVIYEGTYRRGIAVHGPLHRFFSDDHRRLDALLRRSIAEPGRVDPASFAEFRAGLLRHIGMEEKVLFVAARQARRGEPLDLAARLRVDHGALAALLVPTPTPALVADIVSVLSPHNRREEEPGGVYDACDEALGPAAAERLVGELRVFPEVPLKPYNDGPEIQKHIDDNLVRARRQWAGDADRDS